MKRFPIAICALCCLLSIGCSTGETAPEKYTATGKVTWNNDPLPTGDIVFTPLDGKSPPAGGKITNGEYQVEVVAGEMKVEIRAVKEDPSKTMPGIEPGTTVPVTVQYIPPKYNTNTELKATVTPDGENTFDYPLTGN